MLKIIVNNENDMIQITENSQNYNYLNLTNIANISKLSEKVRKVSIFSSLLFYRGNGEIFSPLAHPKRDPQDGVCLCGARSPITPAAWISNGGKRARSPSAFDSQRERLRWGKWAMTAWPGWPCSSHVDPTFAVLTLLSSQTQLWATNKPNVKYHPLQMTKGWAKTCSNGSFDSVFWGLVCRSLFSLKSFNK